MFKYYLTKRPAAPGSIPAGAVNVINYNFKTYINEIHCEAWAAVEYLQPLPDPVIESYELTPEDATPDRRKLELDAGRVLMSKGLKGREALARVQALTVPELLEILR